MLNANSIKEKLSQQIKEINILSNTLGMRFLSNAQSRQLFLREIDEVIDDVVRDIGINCLSVRGGIERLNREIAYLKEQQSKVYMQKALQYAAVEKREREGRNQLILKQIGFIGGGTQIFSGFGVCAASLGTACIAFGAPLITHGFNNFYESGYYLLFQREKQGFARQGYHKAAQLLGYNGKNADYAYAGVDLALSSYGLGRLVLREDAFRLFKNINSDFIRGWQTMGKVSLGAEMLTNIATVYGVHQLSKETQ